MADDVDDLKDLPPSAKLLYKVLEYEGQLTQKELIAESMLSARTVRHGLADLEESGFIEEQINPKDARQSLYTISSTDSQPAAPGGNAQVAE